MYNGVMDAEVVGDITEKPRGSLVRTENRMYHKRVYHSTFFKPKTLIKKLIVTPALKMSTKHR